jgi:S-adenosyl-L-methionine hydrolase (adenosine-forming)
MTLTTDFGHKGPFVATMKGVMLSRFPAGKIIDLTHETDVHFPAEAGFWLSRSYRYFPLGTTHVAVVDPGVGTKRDIIVVVRDGHAFLAPDNGLLAPIAEHPSAEVHALDVARMDRFGIREVSATFHGRDIFAPLAAELASGRVQPGDIGPAVTSIVPSWAEEPRADARRVSGIVITVDNFGNLITNIDDSLIQGMKKPSVKACGKQLALRRTYGDVTPGDYLALVNSFGVVEIARAEGSAAEALGAGRGAPVVVTDEGGASS